MVYTLHKKVDFMPAPSLKEQIARTDNTFERADRWWVGKCLICNGRLSFDARGGFGANVEHIVPRTEGGDNDLLNLGLTHPHVGNAPTLPATRPSSAVFWHGAKAAGATRSPRKISKTRAGTAAGRTLAGTSTRRAPP
jgi:hypothetical protein